MKKQNKIKRAYLIRFYDTRTNAPYYITQKYDGVTSIMKNAKIFETAYLAEKHIAIIKKDFSKHSKKDFQGFFYLTKCFLREEYWNGASWASNKFTIKKLTRNYIYDFINNL